MPAGVGVQIFIFMKKLILAGVIVFVDPGSITQVGFFVCIPCPLRDVASISRLQHATEWLIAVATAICRDHGVLRELWSTGALSAVQKRADNEVCPACRDKLVFYDKLHTTDGDRSGW